MTSTARHRRRPLSIVLITAFIAAFTLVGVGAVAAPATTLGASVTKVAACGANLRTSPYRTAKLKRTLRTGARVTVVAKVTGGRWSVVCAGDAAARRSWYRISAINGKSVRSLYGVRYLYGATGLFRAVTTSAPTPVPPPPTPPPPVPPPPAGTCGSLQAIVNAAPAGTTVTAPACTYHETVTINKPLTLRGYGATIDGGNQRARWMVIAASDVTVEGFTMVGAMAGGVQSGSLDVDGHNRFTARNLVLRGGSYAALRLWTGSGHRVEGTTISGAPSLGIIGWHVSSTVMTGNHISGNNTAGFNPGWEAGGVKLIGSSGVTFSNNEVDHNAGKGFWCDGMSTGVTITGNRFHDNAHAGIFFEISSGATITGNQVWENGWGFPVWGWGAGITISSSANAEVANNKVAWNADGIAVLSQGRSDAPAVVGNSVHDNAIALAPQPSDSSDKMALGWLQDWSGPMFASTSNNRGTGNDYWVSTPEPHWARFGWAGPQNTLTAFNGTPGEEGGLYVTSTTLSQLLTSAGMPTTPRAR